MLWTLRRWLGLAQPEDEPVDVDPETFVRPPNVAFDQPRMDAIRARPDDPDVYLAYAEWLTEQNDPRGDLILAMMGGDDTLPTEPLLLGNIPRHDCLRVTWRWGFWSELSFVDPWGDIGAEPLREAFQHPSAAVLDSLHLTSGRMEPLADLLADGPVLTVRRVVIQAEGSLLGAWAAVWSQIPDVEHLELHGTHPQFGALSLPELRVLQIHGLLDDAGYEALRTAHLPRLEQLIVPRPDRLKDVFGDRVQGSD